MSTIAEAHYWVRWDSTSHGHFVLPLSLDTDAVMLAVLDPGIKGTHARLGICEAVRTKVIEEYPEISSEYVSFENLAFVPLPDLAVPAPTP